MGRPVAYLAALILGLGVPLSALAGSAGLQHFSSTANPYSVDYPAGWRHVSGHLRGAYSLFSYDEFYDPVPAHGFNVNVVVAQLPVPNALTSAAYARQSIQSLDASGLHARQEGTVMVAGRRAPLVSYTDTRAHLQAYVVIKRDVWVFGLTTAIGDTPAWRATFLSMLHSVRMR